MSQVRLAVSAFWALLALGNLPFVCLLGASAAASSDADITVRASSPCPPSLWVEGTHDYRNRDLTDWDRWKYKDMWDAHVGIALGRMDVGEYSRRVMADLHYALARWPNHIPVLQALVRYELAGGRRYEYQLTECYFVSARAFAPDDIAVLLSEGYYYWKKGALTRAKTAYEDALRIDPSSADAHYNLGLILVELRDYVQARQHATAAYAAGFPLPGLMNKLKQAGQWEAPQHGTELK